MSDKKVTHIKANDKGKDKRDIENIHLSYLGALLCEAIEELRDELMTICPELVRVLYRSPKYGKVLYRKDNLEEAIMLIREQEKNQNN